MRGLYAGNNTDANDDVVKHSVRDAGDVEAAAEPADARMKVDSRGQVTRKDVGTGGSCDSSGMFIKTYRIITQSDIDMKRSALAVAMRDPYYEHSEMIERRRDGKTVSQKMCTLKDNLETAITGFLEMKGREDESVNELEHGEACDDAVESVLSELLSPDIFFYPSRVDQVKHLLLDIRPDHWKKAGYLPAEAVIKSHEEVNRVERVRNVLRHLTWLIESREYVDAAACLAYYKTRPIEDRTSLESVGALIGIFTDNTLEVGLAELSLHQVKPEWDARNQKGLTSG